MQSHYREYHNFGWKFGRRLILPLSFWWAQLERELRRVKKLKINYKYIWWCPENALRPAGPPSDRVPGANFERLKNEVSVGY